MKKKNAATPTMVTQKGKAMAKAAIEEAAGRQSAAQMRKANQRTNLRGNLTRRVGRGGTLSLSTKKSGTALKPVNVAGKVSRVERNAAKNIKAKVVKPLTRTIKGEMSAKALLDGEKRKTQRSKALFNDPISPFQRSSSALTLTL